MFSINSTTFSNKSYFLTHTTPRSVTGNPYSYVTVPYSPGHSSLLLVLCYHTKSHNMDCKFFWFLLLTDISLESNPTSLLFKMHDFANTLSDFFLVSGNYIIHVRASETSVYFKKTTRRYIRERCLFMLFTANDCC
jgi:hypothetical protein